jgi:hypothetical protein
MDSFDSPIPNYIKPMGIVNSCKTLEQLEIAEIYVELFKLKYKINEYNEFNQIFKKCIFSKKMKLKNGWNNKD